ncbi:hypothetical protein [Collinsella sp. HCP28S3_B9]|uniref:hypothetical protein n=1 Tax=Collinsella sp. HCP28S3_B9 TaxID=3438920 RepID=UPI003F8AA279
MTVELPKDAEGREIPLDTEVLYDKEGKRREVDWYTFYPDKDIWDVVLADSSAHFSPHNLSLTPPDSWKKLLDDLGRGADALNYESCAYFGKSACDCSSCIADKGKTCERVVMRDIALRIRKLRGED